MHRVCHTELDEIEGRTTPPRLPVVPGHQVVGRVVACGANVSGIGIGQRVGIAWVFSACGRCGQCRAGNENLCPDCRATGKDADGGYAEYLTVPAAFAHPIPDVFTDAEAAPLLCAGAIGYRSLRLAGLRNGSPLGLTGFGASAHLVLQMARHRYPDSAVYVFARNPEERQFALQSGRPGPATRRRRHRCSCRRSSIRRRGPIIGQLLEANKEAQAVGEIQTRDDAVKLAEQWIAERNYGRHTE